MSRSARARVDDILDAIAGIRGATQDIAYEQFAASWQLQRAVERGLEIISEASRGLPDELKALTTHVPWPSVAAIGNLLRHEYQRVEPRIVWNITLEHIERLRDAAETMARHLDAD